jgi:hypothetical protein
MPVIHCKKCHHEWEGKFHSKCDWCGAESYVLEEQSDLENLLYDKDKLRELVEGLRKELKTGDDPFS